MTKDDFVRNILENRDMLYRVSFSLVQNPHDQDDAVQECIKKALDKRKSLRQDVYFQTWITRILINECNLIHRRRKREVLLDTIHASLPQNADIDMIDTLLYLDIKLRVPFQLSYVEGYTNREISQILNIPEGTVKWRLAKARHLLKEYFEEGRMEI